MGGKKGNKSKKNKTKKEKKQELQKKVQDRFKQRVSEGKSGLTGGPKGESVSSYRKRQKQQVQDAARKRNETFQANKKLKAQGGTSAQVAKDNKQYGNTVPAGSFGISEAGKKQAAANRAARTAPEGGYTISDAGRKQAAAQLQEKRAAA